MECSNTAGNEPATGNTSNGGNNNSHGSNGGTDTGASSGDDETCKKRIKYLRYKLHSKEIERLRAFKTVVRDCRYVFRNVSETEGVNRLRGLIGGVYGMQGNQNCNMKFPIAIAHNLNNMNSI